MCGRYANSATTANIYGLFGVDEVVDDDLPPSWNIAPTDPVRVVLQRPPKGAGESAAPVRQLRTARWGLVPSWSADGKGGARMINARRETVTTKPAFRKAAAERRCLLPAVGYYEWQLTDDGKVPWFLHAPDGDLLAFAGLYELWRDPARADDDPARWRWTCTVITRQATDTLGEIHDRCPVLVPAELRADWLDCAGGDVATAATLLDAMPPPSLEPRRVSRAVNKVGNDGPELIAPVGPPAPAVVELETLF